MPKSFEIADRRLAIADYELLWTVELMVLRKKEFGLLSST
jgi:hypothetical protein